MAVTAGRVTVRPAPLDCHAVATAAPVCADELRGRRVVRTGIAASMAAAVTATLAATAAAAAVAAERRRRPKLQQQQQQ